MKKSIALFLCLSILCLFSYGCGDTKVIEGIEYDTYGLLNKEDNRNPEIKYRLITGNAVWSVLLCSTVAAPIYFIGFSIYEPVRKKYPNEPKGVMQ